ncbi:pectinesterase-like [Selaginella moellendorffii]|uniref:pectinesterase-like n=1 Tax=Selaginella moellendorffii TaxID=88036 RepID=UPI000D1D04FD|nr:pectinesterase-like [Selaginella moellendorffii]|eukprot:XP_024543269.1 pectinesterase-like [Selaginella moellendorffii]
MMAMDPYDQTRHNVKRVRKRYFVIGLSSIVLVLVVVCLAVGIHKNSGSGKGGSSKGGVNLLQATCQQTDFPQECVSSLSSSTPDNATPNDLAASAVRVAQQQIQSLMNKTEEYLNSGVNATTKAALVDCVDNLDGALDQLNLTIASIDIKSLLSKASSVDDLLTSLSSALTFHDTCIDGFEGISGTVSDKLHVEGGYAHKILSNALAVATIFFSQLPSLPHSIPVRRLLEETPQALDGDDSIPEWVSAAQRRLLQQKKNFTPNVVVAKNGNGDFKKIQDAIDAAPLKSSKTFVIYVRAGVYSESVVIPKKALNIMLVGDGIGRTIITGNKNVQQSGVTTFNSATVIVSGKGFFARDLTIRNTAGPENHQAVALRVSADQVVFYRCSLEAFQDTLYAHTLRQFYRDCLIMGTVDFVFGNGAAVIQNCTVLARVGIPGQQVTFTAQGRVDKRQTTGLSFISCKIDATPELRNEIAQHPSYLGRPWKLYSRTVFMKSFISDIIEPRGWLEWNGDFALSTLFYGEYKNTGPGSDRSKRVQWSTGITDKKVASKFTVKSFINGNSWVPQSVPFAAGL